MIKASLLKAMSDQVNAEFYSAYLYLSMSAAADRMGFKGIANWLNIQAQEEKAHAIHIYEHILDRGATPIFSDIKAPPANFDNIKKIFEMVLSHERHVTELIDSIATLAMQENDHASYIFISWYVNEQVEEESTADEILSKINIIGDKLDLLYNLDAELAGRTFTDPFQGTGSAD